MHILIVVWPWSCILITGIVVLVLITIVLISIILIPIIPIVVSLISIINSLRMALRIITMGGVLAN